MKTSNNQTQQQTVINKRLTQENQRYFSTGGVSKNNRSDGFVPAFLDANTGDIYRSCFENGLPAPIHILTSIPAEILNSIISGFLLNKTFYTREEAATAIKNMH